MLKIFKMYEAMKNQWTKQKPRYNYNYNPTIWKIRIYYEEKRMKEI